MDAERPGTGEAYCPCARCTCQWVEPERHLSRDGFRVLLQHEALHLSVRAPPPAVGEPELCEGADLMAWRVLHLRRDGEAERAAPRPVEELLVRAGCEHLLEIGGERREPLRAEP